MPIKTNHSQETLAPQSGVLKIEGTGALQLPVGVGVERPLISAGGYIRFSSDTTKPEYYDGSAWHTLPNTAYVDNITSNLGNNFNSAITTALAGKLNIAGGTMTGVLTLAAAPLNALEAATKQYVDNKVQLGLSSLPPIPLSLDDLLDVTTVGVSDGQVVAYDSTLGEFRTQTQALTVINRYFIGNGSSLNFDIITTVPTMNNLVVSVDGIQQEPSYSFTLIDGHIVSFDEAPEDGARILIKILKSTTSTDRARPTVTDVSYSTIAQYTTITVVATDITYGTGVKIGNKNVTRIDYPSTNIMQIMIETATMSSSFWNSPQDLTLIDTSGNEFVFPRLIHYGVSVPYWTDSNSYIGTFSGGETINFLLEINNATSFTIAPAHEGEVSIGWLSISGSNLVGTAPNNSSPSRYEITVTASNGSVNITKNFWLLVI